LDEQQKPRGARFENASLDLVTKAADAMGLKVYQANASEVVDIAKKLPLGRLYAAGRGFVPNIDRISTAILLWPWLWNRSRQLLAEVTPVSRTLTAFPGPGTRLGLAIS